MTKHRKALNELLEKVQPVFSLTLNHVSDHFGSEILRILVDNPEYKTIIKPEDQKPLIRMFVQVCDVVIKKRPDQEAEALFWKGLCLLYLEESNAAEEALNKADEFFQAEREWRDNA